MGRKVRADVKVHLEKITNEAFDDIIGHSDIQRKYFTIENNDIIYKRFKNEITLDYLPYLGPCVDFGLGDICLEEAKDCFKFYIIDRASKFDYEEFTKIEDAIDKLVSYYKQYNMVDDPDKMEEILYQTLGLSKQNIKILTQKNEYKNQLLLSWFLYKKFE